MIPSLIAYYNSLPVTDGEHKRLEQYRMLDNKSEAEKKSLSKEEFLFESDIRITINKNCQDLAAGLYRNKKTGHYISFSSKNFDLTDDSFKSRFMNKEISCHNFDLTEEIIGKFSEEWEFVGNTPFELLLRY